MSDEKNLHGFTDEEHERLKKWGGPDSRPVGHEVDYGHDNMSDLVLTHDLKTDANGKVLAESTTWLWARSLGVLNLVLYGDSKEFTNFDAPFINISLGIKREEYLLNWLLARKQIRDEPARPKNAAVIAEKILSHLDVEKGSIVFCETPEEEPMISSVVLQIITAIISTYITARESNLEFQIARLRARMKKRRARIDELESSLAIYRKMTRDFDEKTENILDENTNLKKRIFRFEETLKKEVVRGLELEKLVSFWKDKVKGKTQ